LIMGRGERMLLEAFEGGPVQTIGYLLADEAAGVGVVIDAPFGITGHLRAIVEAKGLSVPWLINTHGHWIHIAENAKLQEALGCGIAVDGADEDRLRQPVVGPCSGPDEIPPSRPNRHLAEGEPLSIRRSDAGSGAGADGATAVFAF